MPPRGVTRGGLGRGGNNHRPKTRAYNTKQPQPLPTPPREQLPTPPDVVPTPRLEEPAPARLEPTPPVVPSGSGSGPTPAPTPTPTPAPVLPDTSRAES